MRLQTHLPRAARRSCLAVAACTVLLNACAPAPEPLRPEQLRNLTYSGIYDTPVTLNDGVYEGEPFAPGGASRPRLMLVDDSFVSGDLDGDGNNEAIVLLAESSGGSGTVSYLAVVAHRSGQWRNIALQDIGDRVQVRTLRIADKSIVMDLVTAGPDDAACCPSRKLRNSWRLENDRLVQAASQHTGTLGIADLNGSWRLTHLDHDDAVPVGVTVTLRAEDGKLSGSAGCNRYFGTVAGRDAYELSVGPLGATRMACEQPAMAVEDRFLRALEGVKQLGFVMGKLVLTWRAAERTGTLWLVGEDTESAGQKKPPEGG